MSFVEGHQVAAGFLAEEEGVEPHFAGGEDVVAQRGDEAQQRAEEASLANRQGGGADSGLGQGAEDELDVLAVFVVAAGPHGLVDQVQAAARVLAVGELGADVADHVEQETGG